MPLTLENAGALVPGGASPRAIEQEEKLMQQQKPGQQPQTLTVKVLRAFYYQGKVVEKDSTIELPRVFGLEMIAAHKATDRIVEAEKPAAPAPSAKQADEKKGESRAR